MAVPVYISNEKDATEIAIVTKSTKEVSIVSQRYPGSVPVKVVSSTVRNAIQVRTVGPDHIINGETLP